MLLMQRERTSPLFLVQRTQDLFALVAGLLGLGMRVEAVAEVPRLAVNMRVVPGKRSNMPFPSMREE